LGQSINPNSGNLAKPAVTARGKSRAVLRLLLWLGLFVADAQRISLNTLRISASIPRQIRGASTRGTFAAGC
jgi:hypothetical protein